MASGDTGWLLATSGVNVAGAGTDWANPGNVTADDGSNASVSPVGGVCDYLYASGFGATIPSGYRVYRIRVRIDGSVTGTATHYVYLTKDGSTFIQSTVYEPGAYAEAENTDDWTQTNYTNAEVSAAAFGVGLSSSPGDGATVTVDAIWIKAYYTTDPLYIKSSTGSTDAGGAWTATGAAGTSGNIVILQVLQDGSTSGAVTLTSATNIENLAGTDNAWTSIGAFPVGSPTVAYQHIWIGRLINTSAPTASGGNTTSEDLYWRFMEVSNVNTGTTLAEVIENATAGSTANTAGTDGTVTDAGVTTLGPARLALNFVAINDDNAQSNFTGETGGDWTEAVAEYAESGGTDGSIGLQTAEMATAGTIDNGTFTNADATDGWGVVGFALIGTTKTSLLRPHRYHLIRR